MLMATDPTATCQSSRDVMASAPSTIVGGNDARIVSVASRPKGIRGCSMDSCCLLPDQTGIMIRYVLGARFFFVAAFGADDAGFFASCAAITSESCAAIVAKLTNSASFALIGTI